LIIFAASRGIIKNYQDKNILGVIGHLLALDVMLPIWITGIWAYFIV
jgi:hypothetical protein